MSHAVSHANQGGFSYFGPNNYTYAGNQNYTYAGPANYFQSIEPYGFDGFPGNPMLSAGITATREALLRSLRPDALGGNDDLGQIRQRWHADPDSREKVTPDPNALPLQERPFRIRRYAGAVRASLAQLELMSSIRFEFNTSTEIATLSGALPDRTSEPIPIVMMRRPERSYFLAQLQLVDSLATRRDSRDREILTQVAPPFAYFASVLNLQAGLHRKTMEVVNIALQFAYAVCQRFKHALACPRPSEYSTTVQPMIEVPMHLTLPAGHATEAHLTAALLGALAEIPKASKSDYYLRRLAHRIAENRVVAGLHFPVDNIAGRLLGDALSSYFLALCGEETAKAWQGAAFDGTSADLSPKAEPTEPNAGDTDPRMTGPGCKLLNGKSVKRGDFAPHPLVQAMWAEAKDEWK